MKYIKKEYQSVLTQENLNPCMAIGMSTHTFPMSLNTVKS